METKHMRFAIVLATVCVVYYFVVLRLQWIAAGTIGGMEPVSALAFYSAVPTILLGIMGVLVGVTTKWHDANAVYTTAAVAIVVTCISWSQNEYVAPTIVGIAWATMPAVAGLLAFHCGQLLGSRHASKPSGGTKSG